MAGAAVLGRLKPLTWQLCDVAEVVEETLHVKTLVLDAPDWPGHFAGQHVDIHCVTRWSKLDTTWQGVSVDTLLAEIEHDAPYVLAHSDGGYTTNLPLEDVSDGKAWVAFGYDDEPLDPEHGGPARLLVPHLYFWKSAKWVRGLQLLDENEPGFWETYGYHIYGDPWREQRFAGD